MLDKTSMKILEKLSVSDLPDYMIYELINNTSVALLTVEHLESLNYVITLKVTSSEGDYFSYRITPLGQAELEGYKRNLFMFWFPSVISVAALIVAIAVALFK